VIEDWEAEKEKREERKWPLWLYLSLFLIPALITISMMLFYFEQEPLFAVITGLAVMNGSINSVIAYMTIQLDTKSSESLQHLENINSEMDRLEEVLEEANQKVTSFTTDLDDAKGLFQKVGVDLRDLDLEPIAEVVEKLKENKAGLNSVLDNMRSVDVDEYMQQAKRIDWKQLMDAAEEIMGFIQQRNLAEPVVIKPTLNLPEDEPVEEEYDEWSLMPQQDEPRRTLSLQREEPRKAMPKPKPRGLKRDPKKKPSLRRN